MIITSTCLILMQTLDSQGISLSFSTYCFYGTCYIGTSIAVYLSNFEPTAG